MSAARPLPAPADPGTMDHFVRLPVDWQGYRQLLAMRGENPVPRITYLEGKLEVYRKLGVRELWSYERGKQRFFALRREAGDDVYREIPRSEIVPELPVDVLLAAMQEPDQTPAVRAPRAALADS